MSLINQMLQDLDKRRASTHERDALPNNVRVLPHSAKPRMAWWIPAAAGALVVAAAGSWFVLRQTAAAPDISTDTPVEPARAVVSAPLELPPVTAPPAIATAAVIAPDAPARARPVEASPQPEPVRAAPPVPVEAARVLLPAPAEAPRVAPPVPIEAPRAASSRRPGAAVQARDEFAAKPPAQIDKRSQQLTAQELAENEYRNGTNLLGQGRAAEAQQKFRLALQQHPAHIGARQALLGLLLEGKKTGEAEQLLHEGLQISVHQPGFAMALARMQVDRGDTAAAVETLQKSAPSAVGSPDYLAFLAALLQRQSRHVDAVDHYTAALTLAPNAGIWQMGLGISLQALNRTAEARDAFRRAQASRALNPELQAFVGDRLRQLQ